MCSSPFNNCNTCGSERDRKGKRRRDREGETEGEINKEGKKKETWKKERIIRELLPTVSGRRLRQGQKRFSKLNTVSWGSITNYPGLTCTAVCPHYTTPNTHTLADAATKLQTHSTDTLHPVH